jgi:hypothetical protein
MKELRAYKTLDGRLHTSRDSAIEHADKVYGNRLSQIAACLVRKDKYFDMLTYLDENLAFFAELQKLKDDIRVEPIQED